MTAIKSVVWAVTADRSFKFGPNVTSVLQHQKLKMSCDFQGNDPPSQPLGRDMYNIGHYVMTC